MAGQVHINSLNLSLNFKPRFENLKTFNLGLNEKVHISSSNQGLNFQIGVLAGQMHIYSLNLRLHFKPRFKIFKPLFEVRT